MVRRINVDDPLDRQRYRCPRGHARWEAWDSYLYCWSCANAWDVDPKFDELHDRKTGETVLRGVVELDESQPAHRGRANASRARRNISVAGSVPMGISSGPRERRVCGSPDS